MINKRYDAAPFFEKTKVKFPEMELQKYYWKQMFKEGVKSIGFDKITLRVSTIFNGKLCWEQYTIDIDVHKTPQSPIINSLKSILAKKLRYVATLN